MKKCCVIMSTYNGEKYVAHQIDSILNQDGVLVDIYIRDDGSKDSTVEIINGYCLKNDNVHLIIGNNVGVTESFRLASEYVIVHSGSCDYYSFSDQDDEWLPNKLLSAITIIDDAIHDGNSNRPILYYSNLKVSDERLHYLYDRFPPHYVNNTKKQIMSEICTLGCTCVFNECLLREFIKTGRSFIPHDAWITMIAAFLGSTIYDENSYILYRQHGMNQSGAVKRGLSMYLSKVKRIPHIFDSSGDYEGMAREMLNNYQSKLQDDDICLLRTVAEYRCNYKFRLRLFFTNYIDSGHTWKEIARRIRIICNRL